MNRNEFLDFIRKKTDQGGVLTSETVYYMQLFERHAGDGWFPSWNWSAFLVPIYWLIYRRMYLYGLVLILLDYALASSFQSTGNTLLAIFVIVYKIIIHIAGGLYANAIYFHHVEESILRKRACKGVDGTSVVVILVMFLVYNVYYYHQLVKFGERAPAVESITSR